MGNSDLLKGFTLCTLGVAFCSCHWDFQGCTTGTPGAEGEVVFNFQQTIGDVSESNGSAFSAGTAAHVDVSAFGSDASLPPWSIESGDEAVITVDEIVMQNDYPVLLGMRGEGVSDIYVVNKSNREVIDYVTLRVVEPEGLRIYVGHPILDGWDPETVLIPAGTDACALHFYPYDTREGAERFLFGEYAIVTQGGESFLAFEHFSSGFLFSTDYMVAVTPTAAGAGSVTFRGPRDLEVSRSFRTVTDDEVDGFEIAVGGHQDTNGFVGENGVFDTIQSIGGTDICGGFAVSFESSNPAVLELVDPLLYTENSRGFVLLAPGTVTITATLIADPAVTDSLTFTVLEFPPEE